MLKARTLFSGIGAPEAALKKLGIPYELIDFCEVDKYAAASYCAIHDVLPEKNLGDITKVNAGILPYAHLLVWGFPCTDISVAGKQSGIVEGVTRSGLYYEGLRILKVTQPKYSIIENVKNLTGKKFRAVFDSILKDLDDAGYNTYWKVLNAKDYGVPQNRERVFIVSIRKDVDKHMFVFPQPFDNGLRLKDLLEDEVDEKYYISQEKTDKLLQNLQDKRVMDKLPKGDQLRIIGTTQNADAMGTNFRSWVYGIEGKVGALSATMYKEPTQICVPCITPDRHGVLENKIRVIGNYTPSNYGGSPIVDVEGIAPTVRENHGVVTAILENRGRQPHILQIGSFGKEDINDNERQRRVYSDEGISPSILARTDNAKILQQFRIRKLTPLECWRLMAFTDADFYKAKYYTKQESEEILKIYPNHKGKRIFTHEERIERMSDSQLYKQAGNSIVVDVMVYILGNLFRTQDLPMEVK